MNTYSYDGIGCRTQKVIGGTTTNYTYNGLGRITSDGQTQYTYDNNGNLLSRGNESFQFDWKNNLVRYQDSGAGKDIYLGYDIGNTLVAKGWNTEEEMSALSSSTAAKKPRKGVKGVIDTSKKVFTTTTTRSIDCFADLNCDEEIFYIKSYNTSVMYNMMYEMSGAGMLDMLRHWTPEIAEYNYDQNDPTGLALGLHQTLTHLFGSFPASINTAEQLTTRSHQDTFGIFTAVNPQELELKGWDDHRVLGIGVAFAVIKQLVHIADAATLCHGRLVHRVEDLAMLPLGGVELERAPNGEPIEVLPDGSSIIPRGAVPRWKQTPDERRRWRPNWGFDPDEARTIYIPQIRYVTRFYVEPVYKATEELREKLEDLNKVVNRMLDATTVIKSMQAQLYLYVEITTWTTWMKKTFNPCHLYRSEKDFSHISDPIQIPGGTGLSGNQWLITGPKDVQEMTEKGHDWVRSRLENPDWRSRHTSYEPKDPQNIKKWIQIF